MSKNRQRSLSASRTLDTTVNFVGRIGASLRISSRKRAKEKQKLELSKNNSETWLRSGTHFAKVGIERRRSTCSAIFFGTNKNNQKIYFASEECDNQKNNLPQNLNKRLFDLETHHQKRYQVRSSSVITSNDQQLIVYNSEKKRFVRPSKPSFDFMETCNDSKKNLILPKFINENKFDEYNDEENEDVELLSLAFVPLTPSKSRSAITSPLTVDNKTNADIQNCLSTLQTPYRHYMREGATQLTSLTTLCTHHRYLFLFNDLLLVTKQKGENSYKLKEKVNLDCLWISSNNCVYSFLIGWPIHNYTAHFSSESERNEWFNKLNDCIQRRISLVTKTTIISVAVRIEARHQLIRQEIENGIRANQIIQDLIETLDLPTLDQNLFHYELCFEFGTFNVNNSINNNNVNTNATTGTINPQSNNLNFYHNQTNSTSYSGGNSTQLTALNGVENVYAILMDHVINRTGLSLSDSQLAHLDICPLVNCRLVLRQTANNSSSSGSRSNAAFNIVNQFRKVLGRTDTSSKKLFGRQLEGSMPPQPVLTMIDHLTIHGAHVEGIFRKCAKQATVRVLKTQLDHGQVPDFHQFNIHVTASLLKEYLRSIPGQLLISANYHLWMEVSEEQDVDKKLKSCRQLLRLLPASHTVLLRSVLRLLRRIANAEQSSKMSVNCLAVCLAPSLLENPNVVDSARRVPNLAAYLIQHADKLFDGFIDDTLLAPNSNLFNDISKCGETNISASGSTAGSDESCDASNRLHQSTDSGLSDDASGGLRYLAPTSSSTNSTPASYITMRATSVSPDSALFEIHTSECSGDDERYTYQKKKSVLRKKLSREPQNELQIEELNFSDLPNQSTLKQCSNQSFGTENEEEDDRTPVLSRENSDVKSQFPNLYQWRSHLSSNCKPSDNLLIDENNVYSPDLSSSNADVRILRLKPNSSWLCVLPNDQEIPLNSTSFNQPSNIVTDINDLRISDFIISNTKKRSNFKNEKLTCENKNLYSSISIANDRKFLNDFETKKNNNKKQSSNFVANSINLLNNGMQKTACLNKNETLKIELPLTTSNSVKKTANSETINRKNSFNNLTRTTLSNNATSNLKCNSPVSINENVGSTKFKHTNSSLIKTSIKNDQYQKQERENNKKKVETKSNVFQKNNNNNKNLDASSNLTQKHKVYNDSVAQLYNETYNVENNATKNVKKVNFNAISQCENDENNVVLSNSALIANNQSTNNNTIVHRYLNSETSSPIMSNRINNQKPWRPPKRTAEEIVLDKNLEVNWSVSSIRTVFQKQKDDKPAAIDTVYAKFDKNTSISKSCGT